MKILFDGRSVGSVEKLTGVGQYSSNLIKNLQYIDSSNTYEFFFTGIKDVYNFNLYKQVLGLNIRNVKIPNKVLNLLSSFTGKTLLPLDIFLGSPDIIHSLAPLIFLSGVSKSKLIVTVHDLTFLVHPETHIPITLEINKTIHKTLKSADAIIADSMATKKDIIRLIGINEKKIYVIPLAAREEFKPVNNKFVINEAKKKFHINGSYIIFLGSLEPRKNIVRLLKAYSDLKSKKKIKEKLVIVGQKGWLYNPIFSEVRANKIESDVIFTDYIPTSDVVKLINGAKLLIYPSIYEGFGLPILEAMACGTPVITSNISSMPEAGGDAAYYINPLNVSSISEGLLTVLNSRSLQRELSKKGLIQARKFSWEKTAKQTLSVYKELLTKR